ncbi:hypothetical protein [Phaffia rhodozyma]|uniref:Uncharacterized protein n=1 Tax=Phaffia rhodozyma TaxID=264483 RepID=A0A0F7SXC0_PHARH|nr:hypothetical protein [Phaffia rhodozyma]
MSVQKQVRRTAQSISCRSNTIQSVPLRYDMNPIHLARQLAPLKPRTKHDLIELCKGGYIHIMRNLNVRSLRYIADYPKANTGYWSQGVHPTVGYMTGYVLWAKQNLQKLPSMATSAYGLPTKLKKPHVSTRPLTSSSETTDLDYFEQSSSHQSRTDAKTGSHDQTSVQYANTASIFHPASLMDSSLVRPKPSTRSMSDLSTRTVNPSTFLSPDSSELLSLPSSSSINQATSSSSSSTLISSTPPASLLTMSDLVALSKSAQTDPKIYRTQFRNMPIFQPSLQGTFPAVSISLRSRIDHYVSRLRPQLSQRDRIIVWNYLECWGPALLEDKLKAAVGLLTPEEMDESEQWFLQMLGSALDGDRENYKAGIGSAFLNVDLRDVANLKISRLTPISTFGMVVGNVNKYIDVQDGHAKQLILFWLQDMLTAAPLKVKIYLHENALNKVEIPRVGTKVQLHGVYIGQKNVNSSHFLFGSAKSILF